MDKLFGEKALIFLFIISLFLVALIFKPYFSSIILGFVLWILFRPLFNLINKLIKNKTAASLATIILVLFLIFWPLFLISVQIIKEAQSYLVFFDLDKSFLKNWLDKLNIDFKQYSEKIISTLAANIKRVFSLTLDIFSMFFISLFVCFYLFKQSNDFKKLVIQISPFSLEQTNKLLNDLYSLTTSIIYGFLIVAVIQGVLAGIGFYIFKMPNALLFGVLAILAALIPVVGTGLVILPSVLYLFLNQNYFNALGLLLWGLLIVGMIDNLLRPYLLQRKMNIPSIFILISVLGGINYFGPIGFVIGPIILALFISILELMREIQNKKINN